MEVFVPPVVTFHCTGSIECNAVLAEADKHLQSWSYWDTASGGIFWDGEGEVNWNTVK